jgi:hypothetical protein
MKRFVIGLCIVANVVFLGLLFSSCATKKAGLLTQRDTAKPGEILTKVSPRVGLRRANVRLWVEIPKPTQDLYCPEIEVELWGEPMCAVGDYLVPCSQAGQAVSREMIRRWIRESDCDPFGPDTQPFIYVYRQGLGMGAWEFRIWIRQGGKEFRRTERMEIR